jgi:pyruvate/2-oxoglutarate dehydrogenase complex dihydrolipoamide acyltransferase (E2) component
VARVTMPQLGESVAEGTIGKWLKQPGDHVAKYEPLLEVITDKVNAEVPSPFEGTLREILVEEGATVPNDAEIAIIETADDAAAPAASTSAPVATDAAPSAKAPSAETPSAPAPAAPAPSTPPASFTAPADGPAGSDERPPTVPSPAARPGSVAPPVASAAPAPDRGSTAEPGDPDARMTPAVRRLLREHGLSPAQIVGTGGGGRITRDDVTDFVEAQRTGTRVGQQSPMTANAPAPAGAPSIAPPGTAPGSGRQAPAPSAASIEFPPGVDEVLVPMTQMRKGIAAQMTRALQVPHAYVSVDVDVTNLVRFRERTKRDYQTREGLSLSYVPFVVKAAAEALKRNPTLNAQWTDDGLVAKRRINVGVAVAVAEGLIVPVIRDVDQLSISGLNRAIADVASRARTNKLRLDDFGGGTFTVDNTGWLGSAMTMPIINVPEVAILTMEAIEKRPVVVETTEGDVIAIRSMMRMVLGIDHRANDGAGGAALLRDVKAWLEAVGPETAIY